MSMSVSQMRAYCPRCDEDTMHQVTRGRERGFQVIEPICLQCGRENHNLRRSLR